jgi:hypothetical protein
MRGYRRRQNGTEANPRAAAAVEYVSASAVMKKNISRAVCSDITNAPPGRLSGTISSTVWIATTPMQVSRRMTSTW